MPKDFVKVARTDDLLPGQMKYIRLDLEKILLVNLEGVYHAVSNVCTCAYAPLSSGKLIDDEVLCTPHGSIFNVKTGRVVRSPARRNLTVYQIKVEGDDVFVGPPADD